MRTPRKEDGHRHGHIAAPVATVVIVAAIAAVVAWVAVKERPTDGNIAATALLHLERDILDRSATARPPRLGTYFRRAAVGGAHVDRTIEVANGEERARRHRAAPRVDGVAAPHQRLRVSQRRKCEQGGGESGVTKAREHDSHCCWWTSRDHAVVPCLKDGYMLDLSAAQGGQTDARTVRRSAPGSQRHSHKQHSPCQKEGGHIARWQKNSFVSPRGDDRDVPEPQSSHEQHHRAAEGEQTYHAPPGIRTEES